MRSPRLVLASASPRRAALLRSLGVHPEILPSGMPESVARGESPEEAVTRLARSKAAAVAERLNLDGRPAIVLAADTAVVIEDDVLGKPRDDAEASAMLRRLSGRDHRVLTGVCIVRRPGDARTATVATTIVRFRPLDAATIDWYVATGEPRDKAGAYGIQERGALLVDGIRGSWSNVVGLPMERLPSLLRDVGVDPVAWFTPRR